MLHSCQTLGVLQLLYNYIFLCPRMLGKSNSKTSSGSQDSSTRQRIERRTIGVIDTGYDTEYSDSVLARMNRVIHMTKYLSTILHYYKVLSYSTSTGDIEDRSISDNEASEESQEEERLVLNICLLLMIIFVLSG